ncbi:MAG: tyrosine--tRNA ligase [Candidatus Paceibacterota bacterium]
MNITENDNNIKDILTRGVGEFIDPEGSFVKKLKENPEKIVIKFGVDPTRPDIHLGHAVILHKLRKLQDMGCKIIFLIGDYTAQIGDPTGKDKTRPEISFSQILENAKTYLEQVGQILNVNDKNKYEVLANSVWYQSATDYPTGNMSEKSKAWESDRARFSSIRKDGGLPTVTLWNLMATLRGITHSQLIERDMFQDRIEKGNHLYMHEMMYPVMQGVDSWAIAGFFDTCDLEVGGTDQTFNMLMGRHIMKNNKQEPQSVLAFQLLVGLDGKEKMSKSLDNYIAITDTPEDMYGKVMSIPDNAIVSYFELCTFTPMSEVLNIKKGLEENTIHPKEIKMQLAKQIVSIYHGQDKSNMAEGAFVNTFQKGEIPEDMIEVSLEDNETLVDAMLKVEFVSSKSEYRRLVEEGAITELNKDVKIEDVNFKPESGMKFRVGKKRFFKIV